MNETIRTNIPMYANPETDIYDRVVINPIPAFVSGVEKPRISLNGDWSFSMFPKENFWEDAADLSEWKSAKVPGDLDAQGFPVYCQEDPEWYGGFYQGSTPVFPGDNQEMAYKRSIFIPEDYAGKKVFLRIERAVSFAKLWVNGEFVCSHRGEYNTWEAEVTDYIKPGQKNLVTISIRVENWKDEEGEDHPMCGLGGIRGIVGSVTLYALPKSHLNRLHVSVDFDENYENAELTVMTNAFLEDGKTASVKLHLTAPDGQRVSLQEDEIIIESDFTDRNLTVPVLHPDKWEAEHPYLYELTAEFMINGEVLETVVRKTGFRKVTIEDSVYKINGIPTKLHGVDYLTVYGNDACAYDLDTERMLLETAKQNNINYLRAAHYPLSEETLNLCDELGLFVEQENSCCFAGFDKLQGTMEDPYYREYLLNNVSSMVEKDRSHPCIVMWSIANESKWGENHNLTSQYIKAVDPTVPVKFSWGHTVPGPDKAPAIDIHSNHYSMDQVGCFGRPTVWDEYAHDYSNGNEADLRFDPGFRENYYQIIHQNWEQIYKEPINLGGAIWDYIDNIYEGKNHMLGNTTWGQIDCWGRIKPEMWATKKVYSPVQYKGEPHVTVLGSSSALRLPYENRYETVSFADEDFEIEYRVNGIDCGRISSGILPKETGTLEIPAPKQGWKSGDQVQLDFFKTTGTIRRNVVTDRIIIGIPEYIFPTADKAAPVISETEELITVIGEEFVLTFSKTTGKLQTGFWQEKPVLVGGPNLNLGMTELEEWKLTSVSAEHAGNTAVVTIQGTYGKIGCQFILDIFGNGRLETTYHIICEEEMGVWEAGISYDLPEEADKLSWVRQGYLNYYPEDQLGRLEGTAVKEIPGYTRKWGIKPERSWKDDEKEFFAFGMSDQGGRGTHDFRASKLGVYYAEVGFEDEKAVVSVFGDGNGSVRAAINEDRTVRLYMNNEWGYPVNGLSQIKAKTVTVRNGYYGKAVMQLAGTGKNYRIRYR